MLKDLVDHARAVHFAFLVLCLLILSIGFLDRETEQNRTALEDALDLVTFLSQPGVADKGIAQFLDEDLVQDPQLTSIPSGQQPNTPENTEPDVSTLWFAQRLERESYTQRVLSVGIGVLSAVLMAQIRRSRNQEIPIEVAQITQTIPSQKEPNGEVEGGSGDSEDSQIDSTNYDPE